MGAQSFSPLSHRALRTLCQLPRTRGSLPSQALRASSPPGRAKCTPVGDGKVSGKANKTAPLAVCIQQKEPFLV